MKVASDLHDGRINSRNLLVELTIEEYLTLARDIVDKNEYQRRRVRSSKTIYTLLRTDLLKGCIIPPVVLALTSDLAGANPRIEDFAKFLQDNKQHLIILDGLQRTYTMIDLVNDLSAHGTEEDKKKALAQPIRAEFYIGLNRLGILYRMLTLNTGQTPMSLRQQIEMLYLDYAGVEIDGIELIREVEERNITRINQYHFKDVVEGFNSYLERNEFPIERADLLENIQSLEKLAKENADTDLFAGYLRAWHTFVVKINELCGAAQISDEFKEQYVNPFGTNAQLIFKKAQAMSGFGAAIGRLKDFNILPDFNQASDRINRINVENPTVFLDGINRNLDWIKNNTKKIGNAQRSYFQYFFREILNDQSDNYLRPEDATETALRKYQSQNT